MVKVTPRTPLVLPKSKVSKLAKATTPAQTAEAKTDIMNWLNARKAVLTARLQKVSDQEASIYSVIQELYADLGEVNLLIDQYFE
jgi:hypothetical protein